MPTSFTNLLDVAIVLAALYIALSTLTSFLNEQIATFLKLRGRKLFLGVANLVSTRTLANAIFDHAAISSTVNSKGGIQSRPSAPNRPSYADPHNFAIAFWDELANAVAAIAPPAARAAKAVADAAAMPASPAAALRTRAANELLTQRTAAVGNPNGTGVLSDTAHYEDLRQVVESLPTGHLRSETLSLLALSESDYSKLLTATEAWFNRQMDAVQGWYTRQSRYITIPLAIFVVFLTGIDTFEVAQRLYTAPATVSAAANAVITAYGSPQDQQKQSVANAASAILNGNDFRQYFHPCFGAPWSICGVTVGNRQLAAANRERDIAAEHAATVADSEAKAKISQDDAAVTAANNKLQKAEQSGKQGAITAAQDTLAKAINAFDGDESSAKLAAQNLTAAAQAVQGEAPSNAHIFGWIITIIAISLGAPFWFDVANKIVNVRNAGGKPPTATGS